MEKRASRGDWWIGEEMGPGPERRPKAARICAALARAVLLASLILAGTSCVLRDLSKIRETEKMDANYAYISGTVSFDSPDTEWMVVYIATVPCDEDWKTLQEIVEKGDIPADEALWGPDVAALSERINTKSRFVEHVVLQRPGFWYVYLAPGCYGAGAFADLNRDFAYEDEPVAAAVDDPERLFELRPGDRREGIELVIDSNDRLRTGFSPVSEQVSRTGFRSHREQMLVSLREVTVEGEIADLNDPRFGPESGKIGYFDTYRFLLEVGPGVYFLEPHDPKRIPVLFVHGAVGFPQSFRTLMEGLDETRFQPWFFFYPSGERLGDVASYLSRTVANLQLKHDFDEMAIVAHSMGGLVSRDFIFRHRAAVVDNPVQVFVSISTPWAGVPSAEAGVKQSPFVVPSWRDIEPKSEFLAQLFFEDGDTAGVRRPLPERVSFYLLFGVNDKTVPVPSEVRWEAVRDARERWPLIYDHTAILEGPETAKVLSEILDREFR